MIGAQVQGVGQPVAANASGLETAGQAPGLDIPALQGRRRQYGGQGVQLAIVDPGVGAKLDRSIFGGQPDDTGLHNDQGAASVGPRRAAGELLKQGVQRPQRQFAAPPARAQKRADQPDTAGAHAKAARPWPSDHIIDLGAFDDEIGVFRIADTDSADEAVQFDALNLDVRDDAFAVQPADQGVAGHSAAVEVKPRHHDRQQEGDNANDQKDASAQCAAADGRDCGVRVGQAWDRGGVP